ncbi:TPR repeat-containing thioredoxin TTL4-like [Cornus florida]|uniref:TPR repeat-containing thioredoxin TTL4-like n=1 Tax=Cornus florida TaxID=4283 RepID=UPI002896748C|nr:TPR repeat-containing thioredoxin TTL4-like [Cornus florida]
MGFDWDKVLQSSSKFSVSTGKKQHRKNVVAATTTNAITDSLSTIAGKVEEKIPVRPLKCSKSDGSMRNLKHENCGKDMSGLKSIKVGSRNGRHLNVKNQRVLIHEKERVMSGVKGNPLPNLTPNPSPSSSSRNSRKRLLRSNLSIDGSLKTAKTETSKPPVRIDNRSVVSESSGSSHLGLLTPKSTHGGDILSYGNIYKASKNSISEKDPPHSKNVQVNDIVPQGNGDMFSGVFSPVQRTNNNVFGFGGRNYGHGSIIKGVMNVEKLRSKREVIDIKGMTDKQNSLIPKSTSQFESVEELKNAGNEKYRRGLFMEAISFYNKAIELCPQNAACHNNKAAALTGLGKLTDAVEECLQTINCDPSYCRAHFRLGTLYTRLGIIENAKWHFKLSGHGHGSEVMQRLLHLEDHLRNMEKAQKEENWDNALAESTLSIQAGADASDQVVAVKGEALLKLHKAKEALELLMGFRNSSECRSRRAYEESSSLLLLETQAYLYLGRFEEGIVAAEQAVKLDPNSKSFLWLKIATCVGDARKAGNEYFKAGKYLEARTMYDKGLQYAPKNSILLCNRAACRSELGQWEMAIDDCSAALRNRPNYSKALLRRARAYAKLGRWEESLRDYLTLSKAIPEDQTIYDSLLEVQMELKKAQYL